MMKNFFVVLILSTVSVFAECPEGFEVLPNGACSQIENDSQSFCVDPEVGSCDDETVELIAAAKKTKEAYLTLHRSADCLSNRSQKEIETQGALVKKARVIKGNFEIWSQNAGTMTDLVEAYAKTGSPYFPHFARPVETRRALDQVKENFDVLGALGLNYPESLSAWRLDALIYVRTSGLNGEEVIDSFCSLMNSESMKYMMSSTAFFSSDDLSASIRGHQRTHENIQLLGDLFESPGFRLYMGLAGQQ